MSYTKLKNFSEDRDRGADAESLWMQLVDYLPVASRDLLQSCKMVEPDFLELGNRLQAVHTQVNELTRMTVESIQGKPGEDNADLLNGIVGDGQQALFRLGDFHDKMAGRVRQVAKVIKLLARLNSTASALNRISKMLKMVGLNISVESARDEEARESFQTLAEEIKDVADTVSQASSAMREDAENVGRHLAGASEEIDRNLKHLRALTQSADVDLKAAVPKARHVYALSREAINKAGGQAERISSRVGQIVVGIQIHDNISQRIDHIAKSLLEINADDRSPGADWTDTVEGEKLGAAYAVCKLQDTQLEHLIDEVKTVRQSSLEAFSTIGAIVDDIVADLGDSGTDRHRTSDQDPVNELKSALTSLQALVGQGAQRVKLLRSAVKKSTAASDRLKQHLVNIRDINFDIHLKALNALVRSIRLGVKGRAIGALVQEIKELADQSDDFVMVVEAIISDVNGIIDGLGGDFLADAQENDGGRESLDAGIQRFSAACQASADSARDICRLGTILKNDLQKVVRKLAFLNRFADALSGHRRDLEQWAARLSPWSDSTAAARLFDEARISRRYTMEQERRIHQASLGDLRPEESEDNPAAVSAVVGMERFDDGSGGDPVAGRQDADRCDAATLAADEMDDFGDNVELF